MLIRSRELRVATEPTRLNIGARSLTARAGFTLIELVVVIGIMILLVAIAAPAVGPALSSNHQAQAITTFAAFISNAQANGAKAIRVERAFKTDKYGQMVDANGRYPADPGFSGAVWSDHQQVRMLRAVDAGRTYEAFGEPMALPKGGWLAPVYCLNSGFVPLYWTGNYAPQGNYFSLPNPAQYSPLDTFYIGFDQNGALQTIPLGTSVTPQLAYRDLFQIVDYTSTGEPISAMVIHPHDSATGVIVYDRSRLEERTGAANRSSYMAKEGRPYYVNRFTGNLIGGEQP